MPIEIQIQKSVSPQNAGTVTVKLNGSLDTVTAPELERQLAPVLGGPIRDLVFDLAQLKFISSAGLRVFASARKHLKEKGGQTSFIHMQPQIEEVQEFSQGRASTDHEQWSDANPGFLQQQVKGTGRGGRICIADGFIDRHDSALGTATSAT